MRKIELEDGEQLLGLALVWMLIAVVVLIVTAVSLQTDELERRSQTTAAQAREAERIQHRYGRISTRKHRGLLIVSVLGDVSPAFDEAERRPSMVLALDGHGRIVHREVHGKGRNRRMGQLR